MLAMVKRNMMLYFRNRSGVIFSLLGALISFVLYLVFLKKGISSNWVGISHKNQLLDTWLISGTLAITGITTTLTALSQMVKDKEQHVLEDLSLTDAGPMSIRFGYLLSATLIGIIMQLIMLVLMGLYFNVTDKMSFQMSQVVPTLGIMVLSAILATLVNSILVNRLKSVDSFGRLTTIIGTASGFLVGTYIPIGSLPTFAQTIMKVTPGSYIASLYRQVLMNDTIKDTFQQESAVRYFNRLMGVQIKWSSLLSLTETYNLVVALIVITFIIVLVPSFIAQKQRQKLLN
ncbi:MULTISPECIES: ABC transporter permease [Leuconostoc]|uniref:Transport permease protein n=1 Tax=Leuconostoc pseudomesenteroides TaxID=33968 RepID=A0A5B8T0J4_LEUPS|nr:MULTISPECIES: ABC transporter permease [Leuconostoc]MCC8439589.1 multidrug ABC transporter permease [Leuconostoc pseudomesenteroides]MDN2451992.1 ABC transporter permease [Leuconostoc sp. UCMA20149]NKZ35926.1 ABC transporter permease [Leuconostoc pseudomesenteroides]QEA42466.1 ABC transporter permease [Leuconostoc pseudomesenteroides]